MQRQEFGENILHIKGTKQTENGAFHLQEEGINRNRSPSKMTKYIECWGADKPFANITESTMAKNIGLAVRTYYIIIYIFSYFLLFLIIIKNIRFIIIILEPGDD